MPATTFSNLLLRTLKVTCDLLHYFVRSWFDIAGYSNGPQPFCCFICLPSELNRHVYNIETDFRYLTYMLDIDTT